MPLLSEQPVSMSAAEIAGILGVTLCGADTADFAVSGFSTDTRTIGAGNCFLALRGEKFDGNLYAKKAAGLGAVLCILSAEPQENPGVPYCVVPDTVTAYGMLANALIRKRKQKGLRVCCITGSSGKTTVKDMTAHVLSAAFRTYATAGNHNNHIGVPYTILHMPEDTEIAVIETGMNHAGEISRLTKIAEPELGIITNIGTAHIGNLGSQENILRAKLELLDGMTDGTLLAPADDALLLGAADSIRERAAVRYSSRTGNAAAELFAEQIAEHADCTEFTLRYGGETAHVTLPMTGLHNVSDALLAVHAGLCAGMPLAACAEALGSFVPGAMRSERVQIGNVTVIRDYYNANPEAMTAALTALRTIADGAETVAVLGNMNELGEFAADRHRALGELCRNAADAVFFCGDNYRDFAVGYGDKAAAFAEQSALIDALCVYMQRKTAEPVCVLIKGSRGVHMERVNDALEQMLRERKGKQEHENG
ncbi:MAG: UDP-N-acetylmuramoyl-tripeptide--D-alanyl-D-alanine ligase [Oscillospiraceae bacterium]|nr:UDP-N-acetylmuramoyl-tripeptide--D-alanyl-D-alanine ligase [Oscillospiraceae bacterium]